MSDFAPDLDESELSRTLLRAKHLERFKVDGLRALLKKWTGTERLPKYGKTKLIEHLVNNDATVCWSRVRAWLGDVEEQELPDVPPPGCDSSVKEWAMDLCMYSCIQNATGCYPLDDTSSSDESSPPAGSAEDPDADADGEWDDEAGPDAEAPPTAQAQPLSAGPEYDNSGPASHPRDQAAKGASRHSSVARDIDPQAHARHTEQGQEIIDRTEQNQVRGATLVSESGGEVDADGGSERDDPLPAPRDEHGAAENASSDHADLMSVDLFAEDERVEALENFIRRAMRALQMCRFLDPTFVRFAGEEETLDAPAPDHGIIDPASLTPEDPLYVYRHYMEEPPKKRLTELPADGPLEPWPAGRHDGRGSTLAVGRDFRGLGPHDEGKRVSTLLAGVWMQYVSGERVFTARSDDLARALARCPLLVEGNVYVTLVIDVDTRPSSIALAAFDSTGGIYMDEDRFDVELTLLDSHLKRSPTLLSTYFKIEFELRAAFGIIPLKRGRTLSMENVAALEGRGMRAPPEPTTFKAPRLPAHAQRARNTASSADAPVMTSRPPPPSDRSTTAFEDQSLDTAGVVAATLSPASSRPPSELRLAPRHSNRAPEVQQAQQDTSGAARPRKGKALHVVEAPRPEPEAPRPPVPRGAGAGRQGSGASVPRAAAVPAGSSGVPLSEDPAARVVRPNGASKSQRMAAAPPIERGPRRERARLPDEDSRPLASAADFPPDHFTFSENEDEERLLDSLRQKSSKGKAREQDGYESERGQADSTGAGRKARVPAGAAVPQNPHPGAGAKSAPLKASAARPAAGPSRPTKAPQGAVGGSRSTGTAPSKLMYVERCGFDARGRPVDPDALTQDEIRGHLVAFLRETRWHKNPLVQQIRDCSEDSRDRGGREVARLEEWCGVVTTLLALSSPFGTANKFVISSKVVGDFLSHSDDWVQNCSKAQRILLKRHSITRINEWLQVNANRSMGMGRFASNLHAVMDGRDPDQPR